MKSRNKKRKGGNAQKGYFCLSYFVLYAYPKMSKQLVLSDEMDDFRQNWKNRS